MKALLWLCVVMTAVSVSPRAAHAQLGNRALLFTGEGGGGSTAGYAGLTNALVGAGAAGVDTNSSTLSGADLTNYHLVILLVNKDLSAGSIATLQTFYTKGGTIVGVADGKAYRDASTPLNTLTTGLGLTSMFTSTEFDSICSHNATASGTHPLNAGATTVRYAYGSDVNGGTLVFAGETMDLVRVDGHFIAIGDMNAITEDCTASPAGNLAFYANLWTFAKSVAICGNGAKEGPEQCDDANQIETDDCLSTCKSSSCGDGYVRAGMEECDDGNLMNSDDCLPTCTVAKCGDGAVHAGTEMCDDGNQIDTDACKNNCSPPSCGDGIVSFGLEDCDGGGSATADCNENCTLAKCGDGIVNAAAGEECDGSADCTADCLIPSPDGAGCCDAGGTTPGQVALWAFVAIVIGSRRGRRSSATPSGKHPRP
jgi:cysteine-rich repeat protein